MDDPQLLQARHELNDSIGRLRAISEALTPEKLDKRRPCGGASLAEVISSIEELTDRLVSDVVDGDGTPYCDCSCGGLV